MIQQNQKIIKIKTKTKPKHKQQQRKKKFSKKTVAIDPKRLENVNLILLCKYINILLCRYINKSAYFCSTFSKLYSSVYEKTDVHIL